MSSSLTICGSPHCALRRCETHQKTFGFNSAQIAAPMKTFAEPIRMFPPGLVFDLGQWEGADGALLPIRFLHIDARRVVIDLAGRRSADIDIVFEQMRRALDDFPAADGTPATARAAAGSSSPPPPTSTARLTWAEVVAVGPTRPQRRGGRPGALHARCRLRGGDPRRGVPHPPRTGRAGGGVRLREDGQTGLYL